MKTKQHTLIVLLVLVFLAGGAFAALTAKNAQAAQAESAAAEGTIQLSSFAADDLTELAITYNGETNTLTVADGSWTLAEDPAYHLDAGTFAVAGMGALLAASLRAPLTGIVLVLEMTDNYQLILPMIITCLGATLLAQFLGGKPLYSTILARTLAKQEAEQALKQNT